LSLAVMALPSSFSLSLALLYVLSGLDIVIGVDVAIFHTSQRTAVPPSLTHLPLNVNSPEIPCIAGGLQSPNRQNIGIEKIAYCMHL
jgi:hypothetical protein